jgi:hypothetical protein
LNDQNTQGGPRNLSSVLVSNTDIDHQSQLTGNTATNTQHGLDQSILQGTLQGSAAVGDKRSNTESAGSLMT